MFKLQSVATSECFAPTVSIHVCGYCLGTCSVVCDAVRVNIFPPDFSRSLSVLTLSHLTHLFRSVRTTRGERVCVASRRSVTASMLQRQLALLRRTDLNIISVL